MLEKELAQATRLAKQANSKVEQLRKKLVSESHKTHARVQRDLSTARKKHKTANARLKGAKAALRKKATPDNQQKVEALMKQAQDFAESIPKFARAAFEAAEKLLAVKAEAILEDRKAKAANQAASVVERAAAKPKRKPAKKKKAASAKAVTRKKPASKRKAAAAKKAPAKRKSAR